MTVSPSPSGLPTASTTSPIRGRSESPSASVGRWSALICTTARSLGLSMPTTLPGYSRSSLSVTRTFTAPSTTCAFVRMRPSGDTITPDPRPRSWGMFSGDVCGPKKRRSVSGMSVGSGSAFSSTRMVTTAGATRATASAYETTGRPDGTAGWAACAAAAAAGAGPDSARAPEAHAPAPAVAIASTPAPIASRARPALVFSTDMDSHLLVSIELDAAKACGGLTGR